MQAWYHCENVYPFVPQEILDRAESVRASLPNKYCDPQISADLFEECLDEHLLCDELGVNEVSIEHHSGINSLYGASPMVLGILARQTTKVRIRSLGTLITVRPDPVRGPEASKRAFDAYREARREAGLPAPGSDRFAYAALCYVGDTDEEGLRVGSKTLWFLNTSLKQAPQMSKFLPGRMPPEIAAQNYRSAPRPGSLANVRPGQSLIGITAEQAIARGILCAGNPDTVYRQIMDIYEKV